MPRPHKKRRVTHLPPHDYFKPAGVPLPQLEEVSLRIEELEAIRLKDLEGLDHEQSAEEMQISRPTFHRILTSAHRKVALALTQGKALRIEGGHYDVQPGRRRGRHGHPLKDNVIGEPSDQSVDPRGRRHRGGRNG